MNKQEIRNSIYCPHAGSEEATGLALVVLEDFLPGDGKHAASLANMLANSSLENVCKFRMGIDSDNLAACLSDHKAAIIVDSVSHEPPSGSISITDLGAMLEKTTPIKIDSCHGSYLAQQLRLLKRTGRLPSRLIFIGAERDTVNGNYKGVSDTQARSSQPSSTLSLLIDKVAETLKRNA